MKVTEQIDAIEASAVNPTGCWRRPASCLHPDAAFAHPRRRLCGLVMGWITQFMVERSRYISFHQCGFSGADFNDFLPPTFKTAVLG